MGIQREEREENKPGVELFHCSIGDRYEPLTNNAVSKSENHARKLSKSENHAGEVSIFLNRARDDRNKLSIFQRPRLKKLSNGTIACDPFPAMASDGQDHRGGTYSVFHVSTRSNRNCGRFALPLKSHGFFLILPYSLIAITYLLSSNFGACLHFV